MSLSLAVINHHARDGNLKFFEKTHTYKVVRDSRSKYTSVTTWVHHHFPKFDADKIIDKMMSSKNWNEEHKYWGMTKEQIKAEWSQKTSAGTHLHSQIEHYMNISCISVPYTHVQLLEYWDNNKSICPLDESIESTYFLNFIKDFPHLTPYRTEWTIYDEDWKIAGSIDIVYQNVEDGTFSIYDWKRTKEIIKFHPFGEKSINPLISDMHATNYWMYSLQLNTYKAILKRKYGLVIRDMFLVRLHESNEGETYELISVPDLSETVYLLMETK